MAGQMCSGHELKNGDPRESKAYCEGMFHRSTGTALAAPITDNPHVLGSDAFTAWAAGWTVADDAAGDVIAVADQGCCSVTATIEV